MPIKFDCKTITTDDVLDTLRALRKEHERNGYEASWIARKILGTKMGDNQYSLDSGEVKSVESRVRRLLKQEEKNTYLVRNISHRENKACWTIVEPEQVLQEKKEYDEREKLEKEIIEWLSTHNVDVSDDEIFISRFEVRISIEEFKKLMKESK